VTTDCRGSLVVPAAAEHLDEILDLITAITASAGVAEADAIRFESAAMEIIDNIIEHGATASGRHLSMTFTIEKGWFRGVVEDDGPRVNVDLRATEMPDEMADHGRGLAMAARLLDEFEYERHHGRNTWRLGLALS
jgi:serine/threonine-protein kinase RsbW